MGLVKGRAIFDNILLAQEFCHDSDIKVRGGNSILKLDIFRAYDNISWQFIYNIMQLFGFSLTFINLIKSCIKCPFFSLIISGKSFGFFLNLPLVLGKVTLCPLLCSLLLLITFLEVLLTCLLLNPNFILELGVVFLFHIFVLQMILSFL
ncbi:5'-3' exoribonuclease 2 [Dendrobium catenatum]|uniref:5'-3' exoribonuclease 2 n=1 Tax=Dendrobium catenatum TaxID=906689 RepID=A0A2I0X4A3_9ASPA|nr:5'-3' exoribonuclease 2 [Dendrobium catenatum]